VPAAPGTIRARELHDEGWKVASDWYLGQPAPPEPRFREVRRTGPGDVARGP
jgi:hypothetical protein